MIQNANITILFKYLIKVHIVALILLTAIRIAFVIINFPDNTPFIITDILHALAIGIKFDNHGLSYIQILPIVVSATAAFFKTINFKKIINAFRIYYSIVISIVLFLSVSNIKYYSFFGWHINYEALGYLKFFDTTAGMLFQDSQNYPYLILAITICILFIIAIKKIAKQSADYQSENTTIKQRIIVNVPMIVLAAGICFLGLRSSFQRYPLRVSFASFTDIPFYNRIGNCAIFNIYETYKQTKNDVDIVLINNTDVDSALNFVKTELSISNADSLKPLNRFTESEVNRPSPNVVLVLMESMTLRNLEYETNGIPLTPFMRSLRDSSLYFEHFYSAGIHTNNGIVASMYGYSPNFSKPCMNQPSDRYTGLPAELKRHGYQTYAFITGDPHFDNMNSFLRENNFDVIYSLADYPKGKIVNRFGVRDDYMFEYGTEKLQTINDNPFFAFFLTCSNHSPYSIPDKYVSRYDNADDQAINYADDATKIFLENAIKTEWGKNTIFIFVADHGKPRGENIYDMVYYYNRIPCYIYSKLLEGKTQKFDKLGGQIDIFPTVMGLLGFDYTNNTLGVDLLKQDRRYIHFVSDEHLGCADKEFFYCYNIGSQQEFLYKIGNGENLINQYPEKAAEMKEYAVNMMKINNTAVKQRWINP